MSCWEKKWAQFVFYSLETNFLMESNFTLVDGCIRQRKYFEENAFRAMTMSLVNIPLCVMTLLGNAAILTTIFKTPSLSTPAYILLAGLAFSDFTFGSLYSPYFCRLYSLRDITIIYHRKPFVFCVQASTVRPSFGVEFLWEPVQQLRWIDYLLSAYTWDTLS